MSAAPANATTGQQHTNQHVDPEQRRQLLFGDACPLNRCRGEAEIPEQTQDSSEDGDHRDEPEILGIQKASQDHQGPEPKREVCRLRTDFRQTTPNGPRSQVFHGDTRRPSFGTPSRLHARDRNDGWPVRKSIATSELIMAGRTAQGRYRSAQSNSARRMELCPAGGSHAQCDATSGARVGSSHVAHHNRELRALLVGRRFTELEMHRKAEQHHITMKRRTMDGGRVSRRHGGGESNIG